MVRGTFLILLCGLILVVAAPFGHADGGAPNTDASSDASSSSPASDNASTNGAAAQSVKNPFLFIDVPADHWAVEDLKYLVEYGVITGLPNGAFNGDKYLTRYSSAAMVARALRLMNNHPDMVTQADLNALQELLFQLTDQIEQNSTDLAGVRTTTGAPVEGVNAGTVLQLNDTALRLSQAEETLLAMQQEIGQLKREASAPQASATQLQNLQQRANANFIIAISGLFVGIIGIALATMT